MKMKKGTESSSDEAKLTEEKHRKMNELVGLNNISINGNITLLINDWCAEHIKTLHKEYPSTEWLAYCKVEPQGNWIFLMTDMVFPWQKTTSWEVETTTEGMTWLNKELIARKERATDWNCVLHSHHRMGCFWSSTDDNARLSLNDGRQLAWAVVTAYSDKGIDYKWCINFYKPYNIEIDVNVKDAGWDNIITKYNEYLAKITESEWKYYDMLLAENKEYIDSITTKPSYSNILEYLGVDISDELNKNYDELKDKVWNPELLAFLEQLKSRANDLATTEVDNSGEFTDMLAEYSAFCDWSDNLLTQLENNKEKTYTFWHTYSPSLISQYSYPSNRDFEDDYNYYHFTSPDYDESEVRAMIWIWSNIPMRVGDDNERQAWSYTSGEYMYVEEWVDEQYYY